MSADPIFYPILGHFCGVDRRGTIHAVDASEVMRRWRLAPSRRRKTFDAVCGSTRLVAAASPTMSGKVVALSWPPRVATLRAEGRKRCAGCFGVLPGRPDPTYWPVDESGPVDVMVLGIANSFEEVLA